MAKVTSVVNDDLSVYGAIEYVENVGDGATNALTLDHASVGFIFDAGTLSFGKQATLLDDAGIFNDYVFGVSDFAVNGANSGEQTVKFTFAQGNVYGGVAYNMGQTFGDADDDSSILDGKIGMTMDNLDVVLYAALVDDGTEKEKNIRVEATYSMDALTLAATAATTSYDGESGTSFGAQVAYSMDKFTYSVGAAKVDTSDITGGTDQLDYIAGVEYALASNTTVYGQIGGNDNDATDDLGYAVGMQVSF